MWFCVSETQVFLIMTVLWLKKKVMVQLAREVMVYYYIVRSAIKPEKGQSIGLLWQKLWNPRAKTEATKK